MKNHFTPQCLSDRIAGCLVCTLRRLPDLYFRKDYIRRAIAVETVAALPGMVGGKFQHYKALRWMRPDHGITHTLLSETENERDHLMAMLAVGQPTRPDRVLVWLTQFAFVTAYSLGYILSPRICHRFVGYLEEEAIRSYGMFLAAIDAGHIKNVPAPAIGRTLWSLPDEATLKDMVAAIQADEMRHRDNNHHLSSQMKKKS